MFSAARREDARVDHTAPRGRRPSVGTIRDIIAGSAVAPHVHRSLNRCHRVRVRSPGYPHSTILHLPSAVHQVGAGSSLLWNNPFDTVQLGALFWSDGSRPAGVWNLGMECFDSCGMRESHRSGAMCPERCGPHGACCQRGVGNDAACGTGSLGCVGQHCCQRAATAETTGESVASDATQHWVRGFYDGDATWRLRFMPPEKGMWRFITSSSHAQLSSHGGAFNVTSKAPDNRGPIRAAGRLFERVADGEPFFALGTTAYAWIQSSEQLQRQTIATLRASPFNKVRMAIFPKWYAYNKDVPATGLYPYIGTAPMTCHRRCGFNFRRFNPQFWRHLEARLDELARLGIVADLILYHPYDFGNYGFDCMGGRSNQTYDLSNDLQYIRYAVARLASRSNVWWSLANEYDLCRCKLMVHWDVIGELVRAEDPQRSTRPRSIHEWRVMYNHSRSWVTHLSLQLAPDHAGDHVTRALHDGSYCKAIWNAECMPKPIVWDEVCYEGDLSYGWGRLSGAEQVSRFWWGLTLGCAGVTHGEVLLDHSKPDDEHQV